MHEDLRTHIGQSYKIFFELDGKAIKEINNNNKKKYGLNRFHDMT
jgi:hypothetical protein